MSDQKVEAKNVDEAIASGVADAVKEINIDKIVEAKVNEQLTKSMKNDVAVKELPNINIAKETDPTSDGTKYIKEYLLDHRVDKKMLSDNAIKALGVTADNKGGYTVPQIIMPDTKAIFDDYTSIVSQFTQVDMVSDNLNITSSSTDFVFARDNEAAAVSSEYDPTIANTNIDASKYVQAFFTVSRQFIQDSGTNFLTGFVQRKAQEGLAKYIANEGLVGSDFVGVLTLASGYSTRYLGGSSTSGKTTISSIEWDDLSYAEAALSSGAADNGVHAFNRIMKPILQLKKDSAGMPIYSPPSGGEVATAWGRPVYFYDIMPSAPAVDTRFGAYGDFSNVYVGVRENASEFIATDGVVNSISGVETGQVHMIMRWRGGIAIPLPEAFSVYRTAAS